MVSEDGEELDAKMGDLIADITSKHGKMVQIFDKDRQEFKSTYEIMLGIAEVWNDLTDAEQALLAEKIAGKNRAEVFMALMGNAEDLTKAMEMAKGSIGSVDDEMAIVMQSFEKRVEVMKNAWSSLANTTLESSTAKGIIDFTTGIIKLTDACGGLTPVLLSLGTSMTLLKIAPVATSIMKLATALGVAIPMTTGLTVSVTALNTALSVGVIGAITVAIMGLGYAFKYASEHNKRLSNAVVETMNRISELNNEISSLNNIDSKTEAQQQKLDMLNEELIIREKILESQKKSEAQALAGRAGSTSESKFENGRNSMSGMSTITDNGSGYLGEITTSINKVQQLGNEIESLRKKQQGLSQDDEKYIRIQDEINKKINIAREKRLALSNTLNALQSSYDLLTEEQKNSLEVLKNSANATIETVDKLTGDFNVQNIVDKNKSALEALLVKQKEIESATDNTTSATIDYEKEASNLGITVSELKSALLSLSEAQSKVGGVTKETIDSAKSLDEAFKTMVESLPTDTKDIELLRGTLNTLSSGITPTGEQLEKLNQKFPNLLSGCKTVAEGIGRLNGKITELNFDQATTGIGDLTGILEDLEAGNGLTASSFKKISENFPELLGYMSDESELAGAIARKMEELRTAQNDAYREMLMNSEDYYKNNIKNNEEASREILNNVNDLYNNVAQGCSDLFNNLSIAYDGDLQNWSSLARGKADIEQDLINKLGEAWQKHFGSLMQNYATVTSAFAQTVPTFNEEKFRQDTVTDMKMKGMPYNEFLSKGLVDAEVANAKKVFDQQASAYMEYQRQLENSKIKLETAFSSIKMDTVDIKVGGTKSASSGDKKKGSGSEKYASYISSIYDEIINSIMENTEKLDRAINLANGKMEQSQLFGNDGVSSFLGETSKLRERLEELSSFGNIDLTLRPQIDSSKMQNAGWDFKDGEYATTFTQGEFIWQGGEEDGKYVYIHYTPILPDGKVLTPDEMSNYLHNTLEHSQDVLDADNLNVVLKVEDTQLSEEEIKKFLNTGAMSSQMDSFLKQTSSWDNMVHEAQANFYERAVDLSKEGIQKLIESEKIGMDSEIALRYQLEKTYNEKIDVLKNASVQIIGLRQKMVKELSSYGYAELNSINLQNISELDISKTINSIDKQIDSANLANNNKLKANLEYKKSVIQDLGGSIVKANDQINSLASDVMKATEALQTLQRENLDRVFDIKINALEREDKLLNLRKSMLLDDGDRYDKESKESDKILSINVQLLNNLVQKRKACEEQMSEYRKLGYSEESEIIQNLKDKWLDYEQARLDKLKEMAETARKNTIGSAQNNLNDLTNAKTHLKSLLDLTIDMLKKETEAKKDALKEQYDNKKESLKNEYDAEKDALKKKLDLLKEEADARKKALDKEKQEKDYNEEVAEKQGEISKIKQQLAELSLDNSESSKKKKKDLEAQLAQKQKELSDYQYDYSITKQKEAIDEELKRQEDKINAELDSLEDRYKKETELEEDKYKEQLKIYEDYLKNQKKLKEDANKLIESKEQAFYERLKDYALNYTDTTQAEFENCWNNAYEALDRYGDKQRDVLATIETMTSSIINLNNEIDRLNKTTYKDFLTDDKSTNNDDYAYAGDVKPSDDKYNGLAEKEAREKFRDEQLRKIIALGDQMKNADQNTIKNLKAEQADVAKTIGAYLQGDTYYIMINGKKYPVRNAVGVRHTGNKIQARFIE